MLFQKIKAGKYGTGIISYLFYFLWRHSVYPVYRSRCSSYKYLSRRPWLHICYMVPLQRLLFNLCRILGKSTYVTFKRRNSKHPLKDILMDWSLFRLHDTKYPLLRPELAYTSHIYVSNK